MTGPIERKAFTPKARPKPADLIEQAEAMVKSPERFTEEQARALLANLDRLADAASDRADALRAEACKAEEETEALEEAFSNLEGFLSDGGHDWGTQLPAEQVPGQLALVPGWVDDVPAKGAP